MRRPTLLTAPYLAMWLWLIMPLTLHGLMPLGVMPKWSINLHVGGWMEDVTGTHSMGEALQVMRRDRVYSQCRYARFDTQRASVVVLSPNNQHCVFFRLTRPGKGRVVRSATYEQLMDEFLHRR